MTRIVFAGLALMASFCLTFCTLQPAHAAVQGSVTEPNDEAHSHSLIGTVSIPIGVLLLQEGSFNCAAPARRVIFLQKDRAFVGCWTASPAGLHLEFENGQHFDVPKEDAKAKGIEG